jgi:nucleotidyltransferase substrate binding protein (TIGR01987 family)
MRKSDVLLSVKKFERAFLRLRDAVDRAEDDLDKDGVIQRFEFTVELLWKTLKISLSYKGEECRSPRDCVKMAYRMGILEDDEIVLDMIEDRNKSSHIYDEQVAEEIFLRIKEVYVDCLNDALEAMRGNV